MRIRKANWWILVALLCVQLPLRAQEARGTLLGRVVDQTGGVVAGATVEAINTDTGVHFTATTNASGDFLLPFLIPGPYNLTVEASGFKKSVRNVNVRVNERVTIDVTLEVGQTAETVQVTAETPLLDTSTGSMGQVIDSKTILELPLKDGMVLTLATLVPGVTFQPQSPGYVRPFDTTAPSQLSVDGTRIGSNAFLLDGAPNMQRGEVAYAPPPGVVSEFKVQSATFDASYGFFAGAALNMSLKSGTNSLHGQLYYFHQNPIVSANRFFFNRIGQENYFRLHRWGTNLSPSRSRNSTTGRTRLSSCTAMRGSGGSHAVCHRVRPDAGRARRRFLCSLGSRLAVPDLRPLLHYARRDRPLRPPAAAQQRCPAEPAQPGGAEDRRALGRAQPARPLRRGQQLYEG